MHGISLTIIRLSLVGGSTSVDKLLLHVVHIDLTKWQVTVAILTISDGL